MISPLASSWHPALHYLHKPLRLTTGVLGLEGREEIHLTKILIAARKWVLVALVRKAKLSMEVQTQLTLN